MAAQQLPGVVPSGIPQGGYDGPQAEKLRQDGVIKAFIEKNSKLYEHVREKRAAARKANLEWEEALLQLRAATGYGVHDVLAFIDRELPPVEKSGADASLRVMREPGWDTSPEERASAQQQGKRKQ